MAATNKKEKFREAFVAFHQSEQAVEDYMSFLAASLSVLRQGDGLLWSTIEEVVTACLKDIPRGEQAAALKMVSSFMKEEEDEI